MTTDAPMVHSLCKASRIGSGELVAARAPTRLTEAQVWAKAEAIASEIARKHFAEYLIGRANGAADVAVAIAGAARQGGVA